MARRPSAAPPDFVAFVTRRAGGLRLGVHRWTGNSRLAESLVRDLLTQVAARWARQGAAGGAADAYLEKIFLREFPGADVEVLRYRAPASPADGELARLAWVAASRTRRRWAFVAVAVAGVLLLSLAAPRSRPRPVVDTAEPTLPPAVALAEWVQVLPSLADQVRLPARDSRLPASISLYPALPLSTNGVRRALALFLPVDDGPLVLGDDGRMRIVDAPLTRDVRLPGRPGLPPMTAASLAPDGTRAAFPHASGVVIVELATGMARDVGVGSRVTDLAWVTSSLLLAGGARGAYVIDARTYTSTPTTVDARHVLMRQGGPFAVASDGPTTGDIRPGLVELLPLGQPATAPARIRQYDVASTGEATPREIPVGGNGTGWVGAWVGPGFRVRAYAARGCDASQLPVPSGRTPAVNATVVVDTNTGRVARALVAPGDSTVLPGPQLVGWLDSRTVLVHTSTGNTERLLAWDVFDGYLSRVTELSGPALVSVADLTLG